MSIGVAAHITAASAGGPRYDALLSVDQRRAATNGIWLCQACAKLIDSDSVRYSIQILREWKQGAEERTRTEIEAPTASGPGRFDKAGVTLTPTWAVEALLEGVRTQAAGLRERLQPRVLAKVVRSDAREYCLEHLRRSLELRRGSILAIVGEPGHGKTTFLGQLYDELEGSEWRATLLWRGIARFDSLVGVLDEAAGVTAIADALGRTVAGMRVSLLALSRQLVQGHGPGVLFFDTLDVVISRRFVPAFAEILTELQAMGVSVVFTCREQEYRYFLKPEAERLPGLVAQRYSPVRLSAFTAEETHMAAIGFISRRPNPPADGGEAFAREILQLSSFHTPLREIVRSPLLLAMLCELFGEEHSRVPPDLSRHGLYARFWDERIDRSRKYDAPVPRWKSELCKSLASYLLQRSEHRLREWVEESDFLPESSGKEAALEELLSDRVLQVEQANLRRGLSFFHQTFLEYAMARYLATDRGRTDRRQILQAVSGGIAAYERFHWWPILRELLTLANLEEYEELLLSLETQELPAFRTVALGAAARGDGETVLRLLEEALCQGEAYQDELRTAVDSAPDRFRGTRWKVLLTLLEKGVFATAVRAAEVVGEMTAVAGFTAGEQLDAVLAALRRREMVPDAKSRVEQRRALSGYLIKATMRMKDPTEPEILSRFRRHWNEFAWDSLAVVITAHSQSPEGYAEALELLHAMLGRPLPSPLSPALREALHTTLPGLLSLALERGALGPDWNSILQRPYRAGWEVIVAGAVGRATVDCLETGRQLLWELFDGKETATRPFLIALKERITAGGGLAVAEVLLTYPATDLALQRTGLAAALIRHLVPCIPPDRHEELLDWLERLPRTRPELLLPAFAELVATVPRARKVAEQLQSELPAGASPTMALGRAVLQLTGPPSADSRERSELLSLIDYYADPARLPADGVPQLLGHLHDPREKIALRAAQALQRLSAADVPLPVGALIQAIRSPVVGVRVGILRCLINHCSSNAGQSDAWGTGDRLAPLDGRAMEVLCRTLEREVHTNVIQEFGQLVPVWVGGRREAPPFVIHTVSQLIIRLARRELLDGGNTRRLIHSLKLLAEHSAPEAQSSLREASSELLRAIDLIKARPGKLEMAQVIRLLARSEPAFLVRLLQEGEQFAYPRNNQEALALALDRDSPLLQQLLRSDWCHPDVRASILRKLRA